MNNPWFRLYNEIIEDEKILMLEFEDRWHYVAVLCLKNKGLIDSEKDNIKLLKKISIKLGLSLAATESLKTRLKDEDLINDEWQPIGWDVRQFTKRGLNDLPEGESLSGWKGYVYFIGSNNSKTVKIGYSKNPWSRLKDLQTGRDDKLRLLATVKTTDVSEVRLHDVFSSYRVQGEWFEKSKEILNLIKYIKYNKGLTYEDVISFSSTTVATTVATTKETDTDTDTETDTDTDKEKDICGLVSQKWNEKLVKKGKPRFLKWSDKRKAHFKSRCKASKERQEIIWWYDLIDSVPKNIAAMEGDWFTLEWLIKSEDNLIKFLEGKYKKSFSREKPSKIEIDNNFGQSRGTL